MKPVWWMTGTSLAAGGAAVLLAGVTAMEVLLGMSGPLAVASVTWALAERTYTRTPERLTAVMIAAFAGKLVFFGGYVAVAIALLPVRPVPFVACFTGYFIALHLAEAFCLRRLFASR